MTYFRAALGDVAQADTEIVLEHLGAGLRIERMHLECGDPDKKPRSAEVLQLFVIAEHMAHILA